MTEYTFTRGQNTYTRREALLEIQASTRDGVALGVKLARMYHAYAQRRGWPVREIWPHPVASSVSSTMHGIWRIAAAGAYAELQHENGGHQLRETTVMNGRSSLPRCLAMVTVIPGAEPAEVEYDPGQLRVDLYRHADDPDLGISRFDTVTRLTHVPTAIRVTCRRRQGVVDSGDCVFALNAYLLRHQREKVSINRTALRDVENAPIVRIYDVMEGHVVDRRLDHPISGLSGILEGRLEALIDALKISEG